MSLILDALDKAGAGAQDASEQPAAQPASTREATGKPEAVGIAETADLNSSNNKSLFIMIIALLCVIVVLLIFVLLRDPKGPSDTAVLQSQGQVMQEPSRSSGESVAQAQPASDSFDFETKVIESLSKKADELEQAIKATELALLDELSEDIPSKGKPPSRSSSVASAEVNELYQTAAEELSRPKAVGNSVKQGDTQSDSTQAGANTDDDDEQLALARAIAAQWETHDLSTQAKQDEFIANVVGAVQKEVGAEVPSTSIDAYTDVPYLHELSENIQVLIPSISYSNHIYSEKAGAVVLNQTTLKATGNLGNGVVVEEVLSDGVILLFNDEHRFKLTALSSWVNAQ